MRSLGIFYAIILLMMTWCKTGQSLPVVSDPRLQRLFTEIEQLRSENEQHFRFEDETVATMAFVNDKAGEFCLQGDMGNFVRVTGSPDPWCRLDPSLSV